MQRSNWMMSKIHLITKIFRCTEHIDTLNSWWKRFIIVIIIITLQYSGDILIFLKQKFVKCSLNILETLLCDYWNLPKEQHLFSSNHTFLTRKQFFYREFVKIYFRWKCSLNVPGCPEHCSVEGTLSKYSQNIACRLGSF